MENYNEIPKTGTIGGMVDNITANFQLTKEMLERLEVTKDHAVGLFSTLATLQAAYPTPEVGDWALVGDTTPFAIYKCSTAGTWSDTGGTYDGGSIDLSDYVTKEEFDELDAVVNGGSSETAATTTWTTGMMINAHTGAEASLSQYYASSDFIQIPNGVESVRLYAIVIKPGSSFNSHCGLAFYDSEQTYISGIAREEYDHGGSSVASMAERTYPVPSGAKYMRTTCMVSQESNWYCYFVNSTGSGLVGRVGAMETELSETSALAQDAYDMASTGGQQVLKTRSEAAVATAINDAIDISELAVGSQIEVDVTEFGGNSKATINMYIGGIIKNAIPIAGVGKYYIEKTEGVATIRIRKEAVSGNVLNYTATKTQTYLISNRYQPNYYPRKQTVSLGNLFRGYYSPTAEDAENAIVSNSQWVSYPINKTSGYTIHIDTDFSTYFVQINYYNSTLTAYTQSTISAASDIDLRGVSAWNIMVRRVDRATVTPESMAGVVSVTFVSGRVFERPMMRYEVEEMIEESGGGGGGSTEDSTARLTAGEGYAVNPFANAPYYYHFAANGFLKDGSGNKMIASQSLEDVAVAARLGFKFIEANIKPTSDGNFVCIHGESVTGGTAFGAEAMSTDESEITTEELRTTLISSKTLAWIKQYVRYGSAYSKYQTTIPSLDEFCLACKQYGIGIFAGVMANKTAIETCQKYLGNNMIVYGAPTNARDYYKGYVMIWFNGSSYTAASILANAKMFGAPYMACLGPTTITALKSAGTLDTLISDLHAIGCLIGFASVYQTEAESRDLLGRGMDFSAAGHEVNDFYDYDECYTLESNSLPTTTGTISDGIATLASGQTITAGSATAIGLGKGYLTIRFSGKLTINFGSNGSSDRTITSDGTEVVVISDYFLHRKPQLVITAGAATTITDLEYKIKNCGVVGAAAEDATARSMATAAQTAAQAAQTTANEANAKKAVVQFDSIITGTTPSPMAGDESTTCSVVVYAEGDKRFYGKVSSSGSTYYAVWNGYKNYVDTANSNKPHGDRVYRCADTGVSYTFAEDELQRIDDEAYSLAYAALPASTIWSGTQAQYDALTAEQKAAVIAFIEEEE